MGTFVSKFLGSILYFVLWILGYVVYLLPFFLKRIFAQSFAILFFYILGFKRRVALLNLCLVFKREHQESLDEYQRRLFSVAFRNYQHYGLCFLEILERFHWKEKDIGIRFRAQGGENVWKALSQRKGFFFLTAHLGNWELISRVGVLLRYPLAIVTKNLRNIFFNNLWKQSRSEYGLELLNETGSGISIMKGVQRGKAIGFIFDQYTGAPHGIKALFLGQATGCPKGLSVLAPRLGAPIIPAYLIRDSQGVLNLTIEAPLDFSSLSREDRDFERKHIEICNRNLEKWIFEYPEQFLWIHKRFKDSIDYKSRLPWEL
jgi:KDO2-lipid IV(A) lauroyltransferase